MNVPTEILLQYGGFALIAVYFGLTLRWLLATMTEMKKCNAKMAEKFALVMSNHVNESTAATKELTRVIEALRQDYNDRA